MNLLEKILENKRTELETRMAGTTLEYLKSAASIRKDPPDFAAALRAKPVGLIAELKRKSPSAGEIRPDLGAGNMATTYAAAGAQALSILMDQKFFGGEESDFVVARNQTELPILYKEFVLNCWQIWHAASIGASAVLLIAAALPDKELATLLTCAREARMTPLVEVHSAAEMQRAKACGATCIGINNRDLTTFETTLETTFRLADQAPEDALLISESGIRSADDVVKLKAVGVGGILVGEHLLRQDDVGVAVAELMSGVWS